MREKCIVVLGNGNRILLIVKLVILIVRDVGVCMKRRVLRVGFI